MKSGERTQVLNTAKCAVNLSVNIGFMVGVHGLGPKEVEDKIRRIALTLMEAYDPTVKTITWALVDSKELDNRGG